MFFTKYNPMTPEEVEAKVGAKRKADGCSCACLAGKAFKARLEGDYAPEQLDYEFVDADNLVFTLNGTRYEAPYTAISYGKVVLFTHLVPGTSNGWHIVLDTETNALTAFETWFGITVTVGADLTGKRPPIGTRDIPREVQREYYFGWADFGTNEKPAKLHTTTNRVEGRGLHWKFCCGNEILTFFPSLCSSTIVELGQEMGGITMANASDYVRIDDEFVIYTRGEVEFGGKFWIEVMNFFDLKAVGMELGFCKKDEFDYCTHSADLTITGDAAHLEDIYSLGDKERPMARMKKKGARYAYRPMDIDLPMSHEEALQHANESQRIFEVDGPNIMASKNNLPFTEFLVGKQFKVKLDNEVHAIAPWSGKDGDVYEYDVLTNRMLKWRVNGGEWHEDKYIAYEPARDIYFFSHMMSGDPDFANLTHAIDFSNGLATTIRAQIGNWHSEWEIGSKVSFGVLEYGDIVPPFARRHHFTDELVGKSFSWTYGPHMSSIHVYSTPESSSWTIFSGDNSGGATWSSPCYYIKLRDDAYIFEWVEENCNGMQGLVVINPYILHDGGFFFGVSHSGISLNITGAYGRELGTFDIKKYFN